MTVLHNNLREIERTREDYWLRHLSTSSLKLRWRASAARHALHIMPGDSVLEIGAGSGVWTEHLVSVLRGECSVTALVFNADLAELAAARTLANTTVQIPDDLEDLDVYAYDHVVANTMLSHDHFEPNVRWVYSLLRPGGGFVFFEANYSNPQVFLKARNRSFARLSGNANCQIALQRSPTKRVLTRQGFESVTAVPYDFLHPRTPAPLVPALQSASFLAEHIPGVRAVCGSLFVSARKPASPDYVRPFPALAYDDKLRGSVSAVIPCHNEAENIPRLLRALREFYDPYFREFVIVDDNSDDDTRSVVRALAEQDSRVRLIERRPPPGVGRALREGYAAARGTYVLSLDADFVMIIPELRDLFDAISAGHDGAIGSRFSRDSILLDYPSAKLIGNRSFHLVARLLLRKPLRDVSNNLKLYRTEILEQLELKEDGFAANAETGLKPMLDGWDIVEVPIAWVNREHDMGESTFRLIHTAPRYLATLLRAWRRVSLHRRVVGGSATAASDTEEKAPGSAVPRSDPVAGESSLLPGGFSESAASH